ncbi:MAG: hypothetical protein QG597_1412, partial [Actinomycetota bacterium]|nr:hypothetical protein [Actinomycetota bacterium]
MQNEPRVVEDRDLVCCDRDTHRCRAHGGSERRCRPKGIPHGIPLRHTRGMSSSDVTTIKVTKGLRDRLARAARSQDLTANEMVDLLLSRWERHMRMAAVAEAMRTTPSSEIDSYRAETLEWEQAEGPA